MTTKPYTCRDYREEMLLLGLRKRLCDEHLPEMDRKKILREIQHLESEMGMD
jgi:hypothetical protein